jgi:hypothetical protein
MSLYTERNGLRKPIKRTYDISEDAYALLFDCCDKYKENIAWKFPDNCPDGNGICGLDEEKFSITLKFAIPTLYRDSTDRLCKPTKKPSVSVDWLSADESNTYDQYALLDYIEYFAQNCRDITRRIWHDYYRHNELNFADTTFKIFNEFQTEINSMFEMTGLLYKLVDKKQIERIVENDIITEAVVSRIQSVSETGTKDLLNEAIKFYREPKPENRRLAIEKIWDAFERLKTYYLSLDKKASVSKIIADISSNRSEFVELFNTEFNCLTSIGNQFRIRHHETDKVEITDYSHYDYFFNRCMALIALAIQYLK